MNVEETLNTAMRIGYLRQEISIETQRILDMANKVPDIVDRILEEFLEGINPKLKYELIPTVHLDGDLPDSDSKAVNVHGLEETDINVQFKDADNDYYDIRFPVEALVEESMEETLRYRIAGVMVRFFNRAEPLAIENRERSRSTLKFLKEELEAESCEAARGDIEEDIKHTKLAIKERNLFLKDADLIKQRLLIV